ncbi:MAG: ATP-dependent helicase [Betaproteobacteria bacterium]|nr:ATP-dependent helicase [Betaproteobacteria bacterium]
MDEQSKPLQGTLTLDEAWKKWNHISDVHLYTGVDEQKHEPYAGFYRLGRRGTTDEDLLNFLAETEHLPTWKHGLPGEDPRPDRRLAPGNSERLEKGLSPFSCAETIALALKSGAPVERHGSLDDFRIGQNARAEALALKAAAVAEQDAVKKEVVKKPARKKTGSPAKASPKAISKSKFGPTDEQAAAIAAFGQGGSLKIVAGAGTGKTTTLKMASESTSRRGVYIAFNTAMADDAKRRMPKNVAASTAHSMAFRAVDPGFRSKIGSRLPASMAAEAGGVRSMIELPGKNKDGAQLVISQATAGYLMLDWARRHCMGADAQITQDSAPVARMLGIMGIAREDATPGDWKQARDIAGALLPATEKLWGRMSNPRDAFPASHDTYLKVWATSNPKIDADFILFDEAQDANALMLQIVGAQSAQKVYVGDPNQQIYAWRGAVNAMQSIQTDHETRLTESFRFGPEIAEFANRALALCGSDMRLTGKAPLAAISAATASPCPQRFAEQTHRSFRRWWRSRTFRGHTLSAEPRRLSGC